MKKISLCLVLVLLLSPMAVESLIGGAGLGIIRPLLRLNFLSRILGGGGIFGGGGRRGVVYYRPRMRYHRKYYPRPEPYYRPQAEPYYRPLSEPYYSGPIVQKPYHHPRPELYPGQAISKFKKCFDERESVIVERLNASYLINVDICL